MITQRQYLESLNPNSPVPPEITVGDVLAIYEQLDDAREQRKQAAEAEEILDWLPVGDLHTFQVDIPANTINLGESIQLVQSPRDPFPQDAEGCGNDYDDLRNFAIGR